MKCPRCGKKQDSEFYGPCSSCVVELRQWAQEFKAWHRFLWAICPAQGDE